MNRLRRASLVLVWVLLPGLLLGLGLKWVRHELHQAEDRISLLAAQVEGLGGTPVVGPRGEPGLVGVQGEPGRDGEDGRDGRDGRDGEDGRDGVDGLTPACYFEVNQCRGETGAAGRDGVDGNDGADSTVPGPQGPEGPQGPPGPKGDPGPQCPAGWHQATVPNGLLAGWIACAPN